MHRSSHLLSTALILLALGACSGADDLGSLRVSVSGLPADTLAELTVTGPDGYSERVDATVTLTDLELGTYSVEAVELTVGAELYTSTVAPSSVDVTGGALATIGVTFAADATGPRIASVTVQDTAGSSQVRQGGPSFTLEITGEELGNATIARLDDFGGTIDANNASSVIATFDLPADLPTGALDLEVVADAGTATFGSAVTITAATASGEGDDLTGLGTPDSPVRTLAKALAMAPANGDVVLLPGTYHASTGEQWPQEIEDHRVLGSGAESTIVLGSGSDIALRLSGNATVADLQITNFTTGIRILNGNAVIDGVEVFGNVADGVNQSASGTIQTVTVTSSSFHDNGVNGFEAISPPDTPVIYDLSDVTISDNGQRGLYLVQSAQVTLTNAVIEGNEFHGIELVQDSQLTGSDITVRNNDIEGIYGSGNTILDLDDIEVRGNQSYGIEFSGAALTLRNSDVLNNVDGGVRLSSDPVVDLGTAADPGNNTIGVDGAGISLGDYLRDDRTSNSTPTVQAVGVDLGANPAPTGTVTGPDGDPPFWSIDDPGNQIFFGN